MTQGRTCLGLICFCGIVDDVAQFERFAIRAVNALDDLVGVE